MNESFENRGPVISLRHVGVSYTHHIGPFKRRRFWALNDVSLDLFHGETLGIVGRNGAGKSSLLRILAGIIRPDRGRVIHNGHRAALLSLQLGFAPNLSGRENACLSGIIMGLSRKEIGRRMDRIQEFAELGDFMDQPLKTYSTGMRARLGFAVALESHPDILLIDEVLGVGDGEFREKSSNALRQLIRSNKTVVLVSHHVETVRQLCDRAVWIEDRISKTQGDVDKVLAEYHSHLHVPMQKT